MGEVHESSADGLEDFLPVGLDSNGCQTATMLGEKIYVIGGGSDDDALSIGVRILDRSTGKWEIPTVLGTVPAPSKSHSAVILNKERILVLKRDSTPDDCTWFLEVWTLPGVLCGILEFSSVMNAMLKSKQLIL